MQLVGKAHWRQEIVSPATPAQLRSCLELPQDERRILAAELLYSMGEELPASLVAALRTSGDPRERAFGFVVDMDSGFAPGGFFDALRAEPAEEVRLAILAQAVRRTAFRERAEILELLEESLLVDDRPMFAAGALRELVPEAAGEVERSVARDMGVPLEEVPAAAREDQPRWRSAVARSWRSWLHAHRARLLYVSESSHYRLGPP